MGILQARILEWVSMPSSPVQLNRNYYKKKLMIFSAENKMAEEEANVEYISLYGYIRNTPSDIEVYAEHQLRADRGT